MNNNITLRQVSWDEAKTQLGSIRTRVFIEEQHVPPELEWDEHDNACIHLLALATGSGEADSPANNDPAGSGTPVGTARMLADGHIGRMAVLREWRHQGVGSALLSALLDIARQQGLSRVFLFAQTSAIEFYQQHHFTITSDEFMDAGIPHREMALTLRTD